MEVICSRLQSTRKDLDVRSMTRSTDKLKKKIGDLDIRSMTRSTDKLKKKIGDLDIEIVEADVMDYSSLTKALEGCDIAYYLIHSMEGASAKEWKKFAERDRKAAENFSKAATECNVDKIIYLVGLIHANETSNSSNISEHMKSRIEVCKILSTSSSKVTIFRAAVILGASYKMLRYLVERLWFMVCPKWVLTKCQPIALDDVIRYLVKALEVDQTKGKTFDIGGPDTLNYKEMMLRYSKIINKSS
ncbi:MAG TPA: NAD(P)H-binding protein [Candidatus Sulfopaludibacter sp.]|nr:NAD(P)H-binding protein [Candidatus Sulfopaludibacter sp.]